MDRSSDGLRGLVAVRDLAEGDAIIAVPLEATVRLCNISEERDPSLSALTVLRLRREGRDTIGDLRPYLDLLPAQDSQDFEALPDFMSEAELEMLQCPPAAAKARRRRDLCVRVAAEQGVVLEDLQWALCSVSMRSFTIHSPHEGYLRVLLPGIDLLNHDVGAPHKFRVEWTLQPAYDGLFKVVAGSHIKAGEEVRICYGGNPYQTEGSGAQAAWTSEQYLQRYGFLDVSAGTANVDRRWLASEAAGVVREALKQSSRAEDEALLEGGGLSPGARSAVEFRKHLKSALEAPRAR